MIEGTGTYGARLARAGADAGYTIVEAPRMNARANRGVGKSDPLDARRIAQAAFPLQGAQLRQPRADDGIRAAVRVLLASREHMSTARTATITALTALLRVSDLGLDARRPLTARQITTTAAWRTRDEDLATATARGEATRLPSASPHSTRNSRTSPGGSPTGSARALPACCSTNPASARSPPRSR